MDGFLKLPLQGTARARNHWWKISHFASCWVPAWTFEKCILSYHLSNRLGGECIWFLYLWFWEPHFFLGHPNPQQWCPTHARQSLSYKDELLIPLWSHWKLEWWTEAVMRTRFYLLCSHCILSFVSMHRWILSYTYFAHVKVHIYRTKIYTCNLQK